MKHLDSKNLLPFRKRNNGFRLPGTSSEEEEQMVQEVDPKLRPDEHNYVRHYLSRADTLLQRSEEQSNVTEFPGKTAADVFNKQMSEKKSEKKKAA
ncbi:MAG TPA: hypothetical protein VJN64_17360 [Terriglobales bacterium]|nr:hypothetical protein [Terriglobales bacterium]